MVRDRRVRLLDKIGNDMADRAADFGRRRVQPSIIDLKRQVLSACGAWYPLFLTYTGSFIAIARKAVNRDGAVSMVLGIFFGNVLTSLWFKSVKSFTIRCGGTRGLGLGACSGMAGCLHLMGCTLGGCWAVGPGRVAVNILETRLGAYDTHFG